VPLHWVPNVAFGKIAERAITRLHFPRMFTRDSLRLIEKPKLTQIYNDAVLRAARATLGNMANNWPRSYEHAETLQRDTKGIFHWSTMDVPGHVLAHFGAEVLANLDQLGGEFRNAYFSHELRGWKGATHHDQLDPLERQLALDPIHNLLDLTMIDTRLWVIDVALQASVRGHVVAWRKSGHVRLLEFLLPAMANVRAHLNSRHVTLDPLMLSHELVGLRSEFLQSHPTEMLYFQAYHTEKASHYAIHKNMYYERPARELLSRDSYTKALDDLSHISQTVWGIAGGDGEEATSSSARLEVRVPLSLALETLSTGLPNNVIQHCLVKIKSEEFW
ncbi:hypothetical protein NEOLEDRAFT_1081899, partial [Neolentinus lepideus HHB14362 ss-1]